MPTDRDEILRRAEKMLRQGQLDAAIDEYARLVESHPSDWAVVNTLGDLYVRAGQPDRARPLYHRIAAAHLSEGFFAKAAGFYKKLLKLAPNDERALFSLAEACAAQGLRADARTYYEAVGVLLKRRGDAVGACRVQVRLADLDPSDLRAQVTAARALAASQPREAAARLVRVAGALEQNGASDEALAIWREALACDPESAEARLGLDRLCGQPAEALLPDEPAATIAADAVLPARDEGQPDAEPEVAPGVLNAIAPAVSPDALATDALTGPSVAADVAPDALPAAVLEEPPIEVLEQDAAMLADVLPDSDEGSLPSTRADTLTVLEEPSHGQSEEGSAAKRVGDPRDVEIDLTERLDQLAAQAAPVDQLPPTDPATASGRHPAEGPLEGTGVGSGTAESGPLEQVLETLRQRAPRTGEALVAMARACLSQGLDEEAIESFAAAAHDPDTRHEAAAALAHIHEERRNVPAAIEWLEQAAASAPTPAKRGAALYRLGVLLEDAGEPARALAVLRDLKALAPTFRDVSARVARLEAGRAGGGPSAH